jgi:hypothetical protein
MALDTTVLADQQYGRPVFWRLVEFRRGLWKGVVHNWRLATATRATYLAAAQCGIDRARLRWSIMRPPLKKRAHLLQNNFRQPTLDVTADGQRAASYDSDLAVVAEARDRLPEPFRAGILAMVRASRA